MMRLLPQKKERMHFIVQINVNKKRGEWGINYVTDIDRWHLNSNTKIIF